MKKLRGTLVERFWANVSKAEGCWIWTAGTNHGYGRLGDGKGGQIYAHQVSYQIHVGPMPKGKQIDHLCRNTRCVNPKHLEAVTQGENVRRGISPSAICRRLTQCKYGHPFDKANTKIRHRANGVTERICRKCKYARHIARLRRMWAKKREEAGKVRPCKSNSFRRVA